MNKQLIIFIRIALFINLSIFIGLFFFNKDVQIKNFDSLVTVPVYKDYNDKVPDICYGSLVKCDEISYTTDSDIDINKVGEYHVIYRYKYNGQVKETVKTVKVVDDVKPIIKIDGVVKACNTNKLLGSNYSATDNYDGDLTKEIKIVVEDEKTYLEVVDSSGNKETMETLITFGDTEAPSITLTGDIVYVLVNKSYVEPGYKAYDDCDGDITDKVIVTNNINNKKPGKYYVTYECTDSSGNKKIVKREVSVISRNKIIYPTNKTIYLTFDDGPCEFTKTLLDILDEYNVKVTFFVTNQFHNETYLSYIGEAYRRGHSIGVHSYSHEFSDIYRSTTAYFNDLNKMNKIIKKYTGEESRLVRFPGGSSNTVSKKYSKGIMKKLANELESQGYSYFDWNLGSGDTGSYTTSDGVASSVIRQLNNQTKVVLMHDIKKYSVYATRKIIEYGLSNGYNFQALNVNSPSFHHSISN